MSSVLVVLRLGVAAVFVTAGLGKLLDREGSRRALIEFGVPQGLAPAGAIALPIAELAVAAGLVLRPTARWAAGAAVLLLAAFIAGISAALSKGRAPDCHCFGQIHSSPAGRATLVRNGVLAILAGFVVAEGSGPAIDAWTSEGRGHPFVLIGLVVLGAVAVLIAREASRRAEERERARRAEPPGLRIGEPAPEFAVSDLAGGSVRLGSLVARGRPVLLVFTHDGCGPCRWLMPDIARWQAAFSDKLTIAVLGSGQEANHRSLKSEHRFDEVFLQEGMDVFYAYKLAATPSAVLISTDGRVDGASVAGTLAIEQLIRLALRRSDAAATSNGAASSPISSQRLAGAVVDPPRA